VAASGSQFFCTCQSAGGFWIFVQEGAQPMRVHANQINPNAQLDALYAAERAAAKREAERTRKKLLEFASELAGEADPEEACVVRLGAREEFQEPPKRQDRQDSRKKQPEEADSEDSDNSISDWA
jgi:hypothetical protein